MKANLQIRVYDWNPNGTNDIAIENTRGEEIDCMQEALYGIDIVKLLPKDTEFNEYTTAHVTLKDCLRHIAVSPLTDGHETIDFLKKYFKF